MMIAPTKGPQNVATPPTMTIMMVMIMLFPMSFLHYGRGVKVMDAYLGGANLQSSVRFRGSAMAVEEVAIKNYYLRGFFSEGWLARVELAVWEADRAELLDAEAYYASIKRQAEEEARKP